MNGAEVDPWDKTKKGQPEEKHKVFLKKGWKERKKDAYFFLSDTK